MSAHGTLSKKINALLSEDEIKAVLAEDLDVALLIRSCLRRACNLVEQSRHAEEQVWLAAVAMRLWRLRERRREEVARLTQRIKVIEVNLGGDETARGLSVLLGRAATLQPTLAAELLTIVEHTTQGCEPPPIRTLPD